MTAKIYINGVIGQDTELIDVVRQFKSYSNVSAVEVIINSPGGSVDVGMSIFSYLRNLNVPIKTVAQAAYSIAAHIFMAGDERVVEKGEQRLMIHMPWAQIAGRSQELKEMAAELKKVEDDFVKFYNTYLDIDEGTIRSLLENETFLSGDEALELGFATALEVPLKAVAYMPKEELETEEPTKNFIMKNAEKLINALQAFLSGEKDEKPEVKALVLQDANGVEINFPELEEDASPEVGDKAEVDGAPAEGEFVAPSGETWVFEAGVLTEVRPAEEEEGDAPAEEAAAEEAPVAEEAEEISFEELLEQLFAKAKNEAKEELKDELLALTQKNEELAKDLKAVKKLMGSADIDEADKPKKPRNIFQA